MSDGRNESSIFAGAEDDEALDILWSMVMEEGNENAMKNLDNDSAQTMLKSHAAFSAMLDLGDVSDKKDDIDESTSNFAQVEEMALDETPTMDPLPVIMDFTPESAFIVDDIFKPGKVVISSSSQLPEQDKGWERFLVLVKMKRRTKFSAELYIKEVRLVPTIQLNPYTCNCYIPLSDMEPGPRFLTHIETILPESKRESAVSDLLRYAWTQSFQNSMVNENKPLFLSSVNNTHSSIRILTQISDGFFQIIDPVLPMADQDKSDSTGSESGPVTFTTSSSDGGSHQRRIFAPAPNAAMASVAAALSDYPNPWLARSVRSSDMLPTTGSQSLSRKRASEDIEERNDNLSEVSANWANASSGGKLGESKIQNLDRRCKVRLVERLSNVINETDNEATAKFDAKEGFFKSSKNTTLHIKGYGVTTINNINGSLSNANNVLSARESGNPDEGTVHLSDIKEDEMDSLLDGLLVRIVENLMEMASSSTDLKDELNKPDQSGFTLLHYACLYNLSSLIPILFFHGISPDIATTQGNMTPLHLACSAGNVSIVELLVQKGCTILAQDSYGATPLDHAVRNGYPEVARFVAKKAGLDDPISKPNPTASPSPNDANLDDYKDVLMQNAFAHLSLKEKIVLSLFEEKERKEKNDNSMDTDINPDNEGCYQLFSEQEREGLAVAMKLMSKDELDEIKERTSGDMRKWMMIRNYEILQQAEALSDAPRLQKPTVVDAKSVAKKKLDEAIANLVLAKNLETQSYNDNLKE